MFGSCADVRRARVCPPYGLPIISPTIPNLYLSLFKVFWECRGLFYKKVLCINSPTNPNLKTGSRADGREQQAAPLRYRECKHTDKPKSIYNPFSKFFGVQNLFFKKGFASRPCPRPPSLSLQDARTEKTVKAKALTVFSVVYTGIEDISEAGCHVPFLIIQHMMCVEH